MFLPFNLYFAIANVWESRLESYNLRSIKGKWISVLDILIHLYHFYHFCLWWSMNCWGFVIEKATGSRTLFQCSSFRCSVAESCLTLCEPMDCSPPGSSVHEIFQAGILEQGCHFLLQGSSWSRDRAPVSWVSCIAGTRAAREAPNGTLLSN